MQQGARDPHVALGERLRGAQPGPATPRPYEAARAVVTMCTALPQWFSAAGPATPEQVAAQYVDFALALVRYDPHQQEGQS